MRQAAIAACYVLTIKSTKMLHKIEQIAATAFNLGYSVRLTPAKRLPHSQEACGDSFLEIKKDGKGYVLSQFCYSMDATPKRLSITLESTIDGNKKTKHKNTIDRIEASIKCAEALGSTFSDMFIGTDR